MLQPHRKKRTHTLTFCDGETITRSEFQGLVKKKENGEKSQEEVNRERDKGPKYRHESSLFLYFVPDTVEQVDLTVKKKLLNRSN